jgi:hypothetical protein
VTHSHSRARSTLARVLVVTAALACANCSADPIPSGGTALFVLPRATDTARDFFDLPFPSDVLRTPDGHIDVRGFPNPKSIPTLDLYTEAMSTRLDGFGTNTAAYFRFSGTVDEATLPSDPRASLADDASVFLIDVDPASPDRGTKHPSVTHYHETETVYWRAHHLAVRPVYGHPLASDRLYAAVVTTSVRGILGAFERDADLTALFGTDGDDAVTAARPLYAPALETLEAHGLPREKILSLTVFRTQNATRDLIAARDWMMSDYPAPTPIADAWVNVVTRVGYTIIDGRYGPSPIFQNGVSPYSETGGEIVMSAGVPVVSGEHNPRFRLTLPLTPMPDAGYPIVLYAHGTGGDYTSFSDDGTAEQLASVGYAVMGIDQVLHGERNPTTLTPDELFFNFLNPLAGRDNNRQAVLDVVQQARFVANAAIPTTVATDSGRAIHFDTSRIYVFGHSQGGLNMPIFLAIDDQTRGGVLSGAAATLLIAIVEKTDPMNILQLVQFLLRVPSGASAAAREDLGYEHPVFSLLQTWVESSDASNYADLIFASPRAGFAPKSVLQTEGLLDTYATPNGIEALAGALHIPQLEPVARPVLAIELRGLVPQAPPVTGNVAGGLATAGLLQFPADGHFAVFRNATAKAQVRGFFESFATGVPTIPAP